MRTTRVTPSYISQSLTVSTKTEAMLMQVGGKNYFIEYPTNKIPHPEKLKQRGNIVSEVPPETFETLKQCFLEYLSNKKRSPFLHAPSYVYGYCEAKGIDCLELDILQ